MGHPLYTSFPASYFSSKHLNAEVSSPRLSLWSSVFYQQLLVQCHNFKYLLNARTPKFLHPAQTSLLNFRIIHPQLPGTSYFHLEFNRNGNTPHLSKWNPWFFPSDISNLLVTLPFQMLRSKIWKYFPASLHFSHNPHPTGLGILTFGNCPQSDYF